jgi:hypothetical protein
MSSHNKGKGTNMRWPEKIGVGCCFYTPLNNTLVQWTKLIQMVTLI